MNGAQLHLALNHIPVILSLVSLVILLWGLIGKNAEIKKVGLILIMANAAFAGAAYLTGEPAEDVLKNLPIFSEKLVHDHEEAAEIALIVSVLAGVASLATVVFTYKKSRFSSYAFALTFALIFISSIAFFRTAHLGGLVHHDEIRPPPSP